MVYDVEGGTKILWEDNKPTGEWSFHAFPKLLGQLTGFEDLAYGTFYGVVAGASNVYRLIGGYELKAGFRIYSDGELELLKMRHVVLIRTTCCDMFA